MQIVTLILRCRAIVFLYQLDLMTSLLCEMLQNVYPLCISVFPNMPEPGQPCTGEDSKSNLSQTFAFKCA